MDLIQSIFAVDAHTTGSPIRIVTGGIPMLKGNTISERMEDMRLHYDHLRTMILQPPRGCPSLMCGVLTQPTVPEADFGLFYMDAGGYQPMCGAGTMAAARVVVENGMVARMEPRTKVVFETGAGLITVAVEVRKDGSHYVMLENAPAFLYLAGQKVMVPEIGLVPFDLVFGGNFFALVDVKDLGFQIVPETVARMKEYMPKIVDAINREFTVQHPVNPAIDYLNEMLFIQDDADEDGGYLAQAVFGDAQVDISPCGTGTSGRMAQRFAKGLLRVGEVFVQKQAYGGKFYGKVLKEVMLGDYKAVIPQVACEDVQITGFVHLVVEKGDRIGYGNR